MDEIQLGCVVLSEAGRDKGRFFVVVGLEEGFARIADGKMRGAEKPKLKKRKHLRFAGLYDCRTADKIKQGERVHNIELRRMISEFSAPDTSQPFMSVQGGY